MLWGCPLLSPTSATFGIIILIDGGVLTRKDGTQISLEASSEEAKPRRTLPP